MEADGLIIYLISHLDHKVEKAVALFSICSSSSDGRRESFDFKEGIKVDFH